MTRSSLDLLEEVDEAIAEEKDAMRGIKIRMLIYTISMTALIALYWFFELNSDNWFASELLGANLAEFFKASILLLNAGILANCVWSIRSTIK